MDKIAMYKEKIFKEAATKQDKKNNTGKSIATGATGVGMLHASKDRLLGQKTLYHGTSDKAWNSIKKEGLKASKGGSGASSIADDVNYIESSKNKVHLTGSKLKSRMYAGIDKAMKNIKDTPEMKKFEELKDKHYEGGKRKYPYFETPEELKVYRDANKEVNKKMFKEIYKPKNKGKIVKVKMNYDKYKKMEVDPDETGGVIMNELNNKYKTNGGGIKKIVEPFARHQASRGSFDVGKDEIVGLHKTSKRLKNQIKYLPKYIKNNKTRFGTGVALAGTGGALLGNAIKANKKEE